MTNAVLKRLYSIQLSTPFKTELIEHYFIKESKNRKQMIQIERFLHKKFISKRIHGEWFKLNEKDLDLIPSLIKEGISIKDIKPKKVD